MDRIPPQNIEAEMAVLGAMFLGDRAAVERATEVLRREDFYREAHGHIFDVMVHLSERDDPVDFVTVKNELDRRGLMDVVGGIAYLMQLGDFVPTSANVSYHAGIVREKALLRRLIEAASQIAGMAYGEVEEVDTIVDLAERTIFEVASKRSTQSFTPLRPLLNEAFEKIDTLYHEKGVVTGIETGFTDLNYITSGLQPSDLLILAARPSMGKTSLAVGIGQNAALQAGKTVAVFSLEMSKEQLVQRMICSEARVDAHRLRTGFLQDDDWTRLADAVQRLWDANILIDDSTDMSALEMRAKCRRLRAEYGALDLVVVDYLQLMRGSGKNTENRNQEISEIARGLKGLAREMRVPVIALSQLSRAVERREDKRPMLSDLRECLAGDSRLYCADTGRLVRIADVTPGMRILGVNPGQKAVAAAVSHVWQKGVKPIFRVTTETGRVLECTANHPFLTQNGYKPLAELQVGDLLATPMRLPLHGVERPDRADLCRFLGYMVGDGHYGKHRTLSFISADRAVYEDVKAIVRTHFPEVRFNESETTFKKTCWEVDFVCHHGDGRYGKPFGNPLINWLREELGILGQLCHDKRVPQWVFEAGAIGAREFLAGYLATDGCVKRKANRGGFGVHFDTVSHGLARDVQHLLLRIGVVATVQRAQRKDGIYRPIYRISVNPQNDNLRRFAEQVIPAGRKGETLRAILEETPHVATNPGVFSLPPHVSQLMFEKTKHLRQQGRELDGGKRLYGKHQGKRPRRDVCREWGTRLQDEELVMWADSDLLWERVRSVESVGEQETYDICVPETGNFIAEGLVVHNSGAIEAEADVVAFIYRPAYYERKEAVSQEADAEKEENRRPGEYDTEEAEVIIAKQRNGPTGTVKLAFMPKFARFDNLAEYREDNPF